MLKPAGEGGRNWYWPGLSGWYTTSPDILLPDMTRGGGRRRASSRGPYPEVKEEMLDAERELRWWPRMGPGWPPAVVALDLTLGGRALSVRTCLGNLAGPVAARESPGISSLTCTVCACWRRLSSRENRREQWHWNGRSPVCFLERTGRLARWRRRAQEECTYRMCLARCSLRVKLRVQGGNSVQ